MEKEILLVGTNKVHSKKTNEDYYIIEYVDLKNNSNKSLVKNVKDFNEKTYEKIKNKVIKSNVNKVVGIFEINEYDKAELCDIK